jgi:hypothetical protein
MTYKPSPSFPLRGEGKILILSLGRELERGYYIFLITFVTKSAKIQLTLYPPPEMVYNKSTH